MITEAEARVMAERVVLVDKLGLGVRDISLWDDLRPPRPNLYNIDLRHCWIAYVAREPIALRSSLIIAIDRDFGVVQFVGSANDEG